MREEQNIHNLATLQPDYMGLIFYPASARYAERIDPVFLRTLPPDIMITGVFVNESQVGILEKVERYALKAVQLHGKESPEYCDSLRRMLNEQQYDIELIKAFGIDSDFQFEVLEKYDAAVDYFLFDTKTSGHGGSGIVFDWEVLQKYTLRKPYFLSGGIGLNELQLVNRMNDERLYAVDLNSKFETAAAVKDINQLSQAIQILRENNKTSDPC
ncbi:phosphoribosylanthranilate isomerase [Flavihumibacter sp. R14]|nr:phosphoribosylanthranilate isomerase [Flavihumibacter soli]